MIFRKGRGRREVFFWGRKTKYIFIGRTRGKEKSRTKKRKGGRKR